MNKNKIKNELEKFIEKKRRKQSDVKQPDYHEMQIRQKIENCINNFDFRKVNKVMKFLNWSWIQSNGVPNIIQMKTFAKDLLFDASKNIGTYISCGGFVVCWFYDENKELFCSLSFVVDESCSDY
jgi:hypothetical protein